MVGVARLVVGLASLQRLWRLPLAMWVSRGGVVCDLDVVVALVMAAAWSRSGGLMLAMWPFPWFGLGPLVPRVAWVRI